jgi:cytosolic carboxypeptidase protein 2/3
VRSAFQKRAGQVTQPKRKTENLARTGTEYPLMKTTYKFINTHLEKEPLSDKQCP